MLFFADLGVGRHIVRQSSQRAGWGMRNKVVFQSLEEVIRDGWECLAPYFSCADRQWEAGRVQAINWFNCRDFKFNDSNATYLMGTKSKKVRAVVEMLVFFLMRAEESSANSRESEAWFYLTKVAGFKGFLEASVKWDAAVVEADNFGSTRYNSASVDERIRKAKTIILDILREKRPPSGWPSLRDAIDAVQYDLTERFKLNRVDKPNFDGVYSAISRYKKVDANFAKELAKLIN